MHRNIIVTLFFSLVVREGLSTSVSSCPDGAPKPYALDIKGCEKEPCVVVRGTTAVFKMNFSAPRYTNVMKVKVIAQVPPVNVNYPVGEPNACNGLTNTRCPVEENEPLAYVFSMYILTLFPKVSLNLIFSIEDGNKEGMTCFSVKLDVQ